jgi:hypothetical protein
VSLTRKEQAKALRKNPLLRELLDEARSDLVSEWEAADSVERREAAWHKLKALETLREHVDARTAEIIGRTGDGDPE